MFELPMDIKAFKELLTVKLSGCIQMGFGLLSQWGLFRSQSVRSSQRGPYELQIPAEFIANLNF